MALVEAVGEAAVGESLQLVEQTWIERVSYRVVNGGTVDLRGARHVVVRLRAPFDL